jgi:hypothetical protein
VAACGERNEKNETSGWLGKNHIFPHGGRLSDTAHQMTPAQASWRHATGVVHGVSSWLFCILCGRGVWPHVRVMWHKQGTPVKWWLGMSNLMVLVAISLTGLMLLYGSPDIHDWVSPIHFGLGAFCPLIFVAHTWKRLIPSWCDRKA